MESLLYVASQGAHTRSVTSLHAQSDLHEIKVVGCKLTTKKANLVVETKKQHNLNSYLINRVQNRWLFPFFNLPLVLSNSLTVTVSFDVVISSPIFEKLEASGTLLASKELFSVL
jgi:hypothetical protein